jgi:hypothetical protein
MKSIIFKSFMVLALSLTTLFITSCGENSNQNNTEVSQATYACPMDCEKGKTYSEEGTCPVCGMDLKEVE